MRVLEIFSAKVGSNSSEVRPRVKKLEMVKEYGIKNDKFAGRNPDRAVMLIGENSYKIAKKEGIELEIGTLGENILVDFDVHLFEKGTLFEINGVQLEKRESCTICKHLSKFDKRLPLLLKEKRGIYAKVLNSGEIKKGDSIKIIPTFKKIDEADETKRVIKEVFNIDLPIKGGWGYEKENSLIVTNNQIPLKQLQNIFATMRATIEMSMTQPKESRYGGISVKELSCEEFGEYQKVTFEISGMLESDYKKFIDEYKENFEKEEFDISLHFQKRKEATIKRVENFWFKKEFQC